MADEQTHQTGTIDDAIRHAEKQLERRIEELRTLAGGDEGGEPAELRPTHAVDVNDLPEQQTVTPPADGGFVDEDAWEEEDTSATAFVPAESAYEETSPYAEPTEDWHHEAGGDGGTLEAQPEVTFGSEAAGASFEPADDAYGSGGGVSTPLAPYTNQPYVARALATAGTPTPEETEFWTHTRTSLRLLQQQTDELRHELPTEVTRRIREDVGREMSKKLSQTLGATLSEQVERIVRDEMSGQAASIRQLQQQLPTYADRIERTVADELESSSANVRGLQEELPGQFQRVERTIERTLTENLNKVDRTIEEKIGGVQASTASQFERIELTMRGELGKLEQFVRAELETPQATLHKLQEQLAEEVPAQFQRVERAVRDGSEQSLEGFERVSTAISEQQRQLTELADTARKQREALQSQLDQVTKNVTRNVATEIAPTQRSVRELVDLDMGSALGDIAMASRLVLDKLGAMAAELDADRLQGAEDLELMIDTLTSSTQGVYASVNRLTERVGEIHERMDGVEQRLAAVGALERVVEKGLASVFNQLETNLSQMQHHLTELQPAPVLVTVNHPDATVSQQSRPGYTMGKQD